MARRRIVTEDGLTAWRSERTPYSPRDKPDSERWTLASHQQYALEMMDANKQLLIAYDMGTGKTAIALHWILRHLRDGSIKDALVIAPASLIPSWNKAIWNMTDFVGVSRSDIELLADRVTVRSYQKTYRRVSKTVRHRNGKESVKKVVEIHPDIDHTWGAIFVDESHNIGSHSSIQTNVAMTLARAAEYRFCMSATPVHGGRGREDYSKLYGQINFLSPGYWSSWSTFCKDCVTHLDNWYHPDKYDEDKCKAILWRYGISCRLADVFDMPPKVDCELPCALNLSAASVYKDLRSGKWAAYGLDITVGGAIFGKLLQVCSGSMKIDDEKPTMVLPCGKDDVLRDIMDGCSGKLVVFCQYTASVDRCAKVAEEAGEKVVVYDGRSRQDAWVEFQDGDADVIVCQYQRGGVGIDLFASSTCVFFEPCFSATLFEQAKGRIFRKGQTSPCIYYYLYTKGTIEQKTFETVRSGVDVNAQMLEAWAHQESVAHRIQENS